MATARGGIPGAPGIPGPSVVPPDTPFEFRGHQQPGVNKRLLACRNFLADEDPDRCLDFASRIAQVESLAEHIQEKSLPHDAALFNDVKVMLKAHREWENRRKIVPPSKEEPNDTSLPYYPNRLIPTEDTIVLDADRDAAGLTNQIRRDYAPFSVQPENDHTDFLRQMRKNAASDPDHIDPNTNLLWVESRAYKWALRDPGLIPKWMHPTTGIPRVGLKLSDPLPWIRNVPDPPSRLARNRPARGWMPSFVLATEEKINGLLKQKSWTDLEWKALEDMLTPYEPENVRQCHREAIYYAEAAKLTSEVGTITPELQEKKHNAHDKFAEVQREWLQSFSEDGIYFIVRSLGQHEIEVVQPGLVYLDNGLHCPIHDASLAQAQRLLNTFVKGGWASLRRAENNKLSNLLTFSYPCDILNLRNELGRVLLRSGANNENDLSDDELNEWYAIADKYDKVVAEWEQKLRRIGPVFHFLRPGEMKSADPNVLYIPWHLTTIPDDLPPMRPDLRIPASAKHLQSEINRKLAAGVSVCLDQNGDLDLISKLQQLAWPGLRDLLIPYMALRGKPNLDDTEVQWRDALQSVVERQWNAWLAGLGSKITIKSRWHGQLPQLPGTLYRYHQKASQVDDERDAAIIIALTSKLRAGIDETSDANYWQDTEALLREFFYPAIRKKHDVFQNTESGAKKNQRQAEFNHDFQSWVRSLRGHPICIRNYQPLLDADNDPSVVYLEVPFPAWYPLSDAAADALRHEIRHTNVDSRPIELMAADLVNQMPAAFQRIFRNCHSGNDILPEFRAALEWQFRRFMTDDRDSGLGSISIDSGAQPVDIPISANTLPSTDISPTDSGSSSSPQSSESPHLLKRMPCRRSNDQQLAETHGNYYDPYLEVDLKPIMPRILALQSEINRLLGILREHMETHLHKLNPSPPCDNPIPQRLFDLLEQFFSDELRYRHHLMVRYQDEHKIARNTNKNLFTANSNYRTAFRWFNNLFALWLNSLVDTGVRIRTSYNSDVEYDKPVLHFQPKVTGIGNDCYILAPKIHPGVTNFAAADLEKVKVIGSGSLASYSRKGSRTAAFEVRVNEMVKKWKLQEKNIDKEPRLGWDESEDLLNLLRGLMPADLVELDKQLRDLDQKARQKRMNPDQNLKFWELWALWNVEYGSWLQSFPEDGIRIATNPSHNDSSFLKPNVSEPWNLQPIGRLKVLPLSIQDEEKNLNDHLSGNVISTSVEIQRMEILLIPLWRPVANRIREMLEVNVHKDFKNAEYSDIELQILVEVGMTETYAIFYEQLKENPFPQVQIVETVPGSYSVQLKSGESMLNRPDELKQDAKCTFNALRSQFMILGGKRFHTLAFAIRTNMILSPGDLAEVQNFLHDISISEMTTSRRQVARLARKIKMHGEDALTVPEKQQMVTAHLRCLWLIWGFRFPDLLSKTSMPMPPMDTVDFFLTARPAGFVPRPLPPPIPPPNEYAIEVVAVEINNLLFKDRNGTASQEETHHLDYLLRALLSPRMKLLRDRIDRLEVDFLDQTGLTANRSLALVEAHQYFQTQFDDFKKNLPAFGIFLDPWWYSPEALAEACSRYRFWRDSRFQPVNVQPLPDTRPIINDSDLRAWHEAHVDLARYVDADFNGDTGVPERLLLHLVPTPLNSLKDHIVSEISTIDFQDLRWAATIRTMKVEFIKQYMTWFTSLSTSELQSLRNRAAADYQGQIDYRPKAERRGIQRAAIEIALNFLATNQEQHRPHDRFRIVDLPGKYQYPDKEVPLCLPLAPEDRKLEQDTFYYTKKLHAYREWKDFGYKAARQISIKNHPQRPLQPPKNFNGPFAAPDQTTLKSAVTERQAQLAQLWALLDKSQSKAPRPFMQQMCLLVNIGACQQTSDSHRLYDEVPLTEADIELLVDISGDSWDEDALEYDKSLIGEVLHTPERRERLTVFEKEVLQHVKFPFWQPPPDSALEGITNPDDPRLFVQTPHDPNVPSTQGVTFDKVRQILDDLRAGQFRLWSQAEIYEFLRAMHNAHRIHFDDHPTDPQKRLISRIPPSGHPENRFVVSIHDVASVPGVVFNKRTNAFQVKYKADNLKGPPIIQPNKYEHFSKLAFRLGRDILACLSINTNSNISARGCLGLQWKALIHAEKEMNNVNLGQTNLNSSNITLEAMATDLLKVAPDLAQAAGFDFSGDPSNMTEVQAAIILQMQILEESNNNWESRFPENEQMWEFAGDRLKTTTRSLNGRQVLVKPRVKHFFSVQRFPPDVQSTAMQTIIANSGPRVQENPKPVTLPTPASAVQRMRAQPPLNRVRHISGRTPFFPFGETPFQEGYLSFRMAQDLKDVPEFQPAPSPPRNIISRIFNRRKSDDAPHDPTSLPTLPADWVPDNISIIEKHHQMRELIRQTPGLGFADPKILEYYYTAQEIQQIKAQEAWDRESAKIAAADRAIEGLTKKKADQLSLLELADAQRELGIDPFTQTFHQDTDRLVTVDEAGGDADGHGHGMGHVLEGRRAGGNRRAARPDPIVVPPLHSGPARNTRSQSPLKRVASTPSTGQPAARRTRRT